MQHTVNVPIPGSNPGSSAKDKMIKNCSYHGLSGHCSRGRCRLCNVIRVSEHRRKIKAKAISLMGSCCSVCGYNKCESALDFHHLDPSKKSFGIGSGSLRSWESIKKELLKCVLMCKNCHAEDHYKKANPSKIKSSALRESMTILQTERAKKRLEAISFYDGLGYSDYKISKETKIARSTVQRLRKKLSIGV